MWAELFFVFVFVFCFLFSSEFEFAVFVRQPEILVESVIKVKAF
jgi:hypothetical protein